MNKRIKKKLEIEKCIIIGGVRRLKKGVFPIKNKRTLSYFLAKDTNRNANAIYSKLYRYEIDGFYTEDKPFIKSICDALMVTKEELVKEF